MLYSQSPLTQKFPPKISREQKDKGLSLVESRARARGRSIRPCDPRAAARPAQHRCFLGHLQGPVLHIWYKLVMFVLMKKLLPKDLSVFKPVTEVMQFYIVTSFPLQILSKSFSCYGQHTWHENQIKEKVKILAQRRPFFFTSKFLTEAKTWLVKAGKEASLRTASNGRDSQLLAPPQPRRHLERAKRPLGAGRTGSHRRLQLRLTCQSLKLRGLILSNCFPLSCTCLVNAANARKRQTWLKNGLHRCKDSKSHCWKNNILQSYAWFEKIFCHVITLD